jgi:hypothetical protein
MDAPIAFDFLLHYQLFLNEGSLWPTMQRPTSGNHEEDRVIFRKANDKEQFAEYFRNGSASILLNNIATRTLADLIVVFVCVVPFDSLLCVSLS